MAYFQETNGVGNESEAGFAREQRAWDGDSDRVSIANKVDLTASLPGRYRSLY